MSDRVLTQHEIDNMFQASSENARRSELSRRAQPYNFRRPDRIAKDQLRSIYVMHETFARSLASSLSAYLRAYVVVNLVSVEQLSFTEFQQILPSPTVVAALRAKPFENSCLLELNPGIIYPILELLLGGSSVTQTKIDREVSEIEQAILENVFRLMLRDLREAWKGIALIDFAIENYETEPQLMQLLAPNEAIVAISIEIRLGEVSGMMNIGIPSIIIKMLSPKFAEQWTIRKTQPTEEEQLAVYRRIRDSKIEMDARLRGPKLTLQELLNLKTGDVLAFDFPAGKDLDVELNGVKRYECQIAIRNKKRAVLVTHPVKEVDEIMLAG
ncbi:MAG: flagellar motor switch protein FliM [Bryobacter sp.]|nr:flagellar motor switch protein FliM [Bryobacter sp.]